MHEEDTILIERFARSGDAEAYAAIVNRYAGLVYSVCRRILRDQALAEDVSQETFLHLLRKPESVTGSIAAWLHTTATWKAIDAIRKNAAQRQRERTYHPEISVETSRWEEISPCIDQALTDMPEEARLLLIRHFLESKSQSDLAEELNTSQPTVSRKIDSALELLRKGLRKRGLLVGSAFLIGFVSENMVEAAPPAMVRELGKMTLLAGAKSGTKVLAGGAVWKLASLLAGLGILGGIYWGAVYLPAQAAKARKEVRSAHFTIQERNTDPGAGSLSKGAYEQFFYLPEGADGPVFIRIQRWDPRQTYKMCSWLQNDEGTYYYHSGENRIYTRNSKLRSIIFRVRRLPTDKPELTAFLDDMEGSVPGVDYVKDWRTGFITAATDRRFVDVPDFATHYEYNNIQADFFSYNWGKDVKIVENRDPMHLRGWTFFRVKGRIGNDEVTGRGCLPFVWDQYKAHPAWLELNIGKNNKIIDTPDGACRLGPQGTPIQSYPAGSFFKGLGRVWMGMHSIDIVRRDAAEHRLFFETKPNQDQTKAQVIVHNDLDTTRKRLIYSIILEKDLIESLRLSAKDDQGNTREGELTFSYLDDIAGLETEFTPPVCSENPDRVFLEPEGLLWLFRLLN
jgi:RNA polymerase sigma-70 factor (ECF subfamily)